MKRLVDRSHAMTIESTNRGRASSALVEAVRTAGVRDERVIEAVQKVARRRFVPLDAADRADTDEPISIGLGQVTTQPSLVARMVEALELSGKERVLEIGTWLDAKVDLRHPDKVVLAQLFGKLAPSGALVIGVGESLPRSERSGLVPWAPRLGVYRAQAV